MSSHLDAFINEVNNFMEVSAFLLADKKIPKILPLKSQDLSFDFKQMIQAFEVCRKQYLNNREMMVPETLQKLGKFLYKEEDDDHDFSKWICGSPSYIFTWTDYVRCYYKIVDIEKRQDPVYQTIDAKNLKQICIAICFFYFENNQKYNGLIFKDFMRHDPYDLTRPNNWFKEEDYLSYAELLSCLWDRQANQQWDSQTKQKVSSFLEKFRAYFPSQDISTIIAATDFRIPYSLYADSFDQVHNTDLIQPYSFEFCFYYVIQNDLPDENFWQKKALEHEVGKKIQLRPAWILPDLKWFALLDAQRLILIWNLFYKFTQYENETSFNHTSVIRKFTKQNCQWKGLLKSHQPGFWGVNIVDHSFSYRKTLNHYFEAFGDLLNTVALGLCLTDLLLSLKSKIPPGPGTSKKQDIKKQLSISLSNHLFIELNKVQKRLALKKGLTSYPSHWPTFSSCPAPDYQLYAAIWCDSFPIPQQIIQSMKDLDKRNLEWLIIPKQKDSFLYESFSKGAATFDHNIEGNGLLKWIVNPKRKNLFKAILLTKEIKVQTKLATFLENIPSPHHAFCQKAIKECKQNSPYFDQNTFTNSNLFSTLNTQSLELSFVRTKIDETPIEFIYMPEIFISS